MLPIPSQTVLPDVFSSASAIVPPYAYAGTLPDQPDHRVKVTANHSSALSYNFHQWLRGVQTLTAAVDHRSAAANQQPAS